MAGVYTRQMGLPVTIPIMLDSEARLPGYQTHGSAGMDVCAAESATLAPGERRLVRTGLRIAVPPGYEAQMRPRSGLALQHGIGMVNSPGTIDSDYRGEIGVLLINFSQENFTLTLGDRIAQMVVTPVARVAWEIETSLDETSRGGGGFGSTGIG